MKIVFEKFENTLMIEPGKISILHINDHSLFSRCAYSLVQEYTADVFEPAACFDDDNRELKIAESLFVVGDLLSFDLNDKRIVALAIKKLTSDIVDEGSFQGTLQEINLQMEEVFDGKFVQMSANYAFLNDWDVTKYLRMAGFGVDTDNDVTPFDKICHLLRIASDLFPGKAIALINLCTLLTQNQFDELCMLVASEQLMVLLYETDDRIDFTHLDNRLFVDGDYVEY